MREALIDMVKKVVNNEQISSMEHHPLFNSPHEGYAVMREEFEELVDEINGIDGLRKNMEALWMLTKRDDQTDSLIYCIENRAIFAACEAIQLAAMAKKYSESAKKWEHNPRTEVWISEAVVER